MVRLPRGLLPTVIFAASFALVAALAAGPHDTAVRSQPTTTLLAGQGLGTASPSGR